MFSPKAYLQDLLATQLFEWVENVQEDSIKVGILEGDIQLTNLALKKKTWLLSPSLSLSLEFGSIEKVSIQIPWLSLYKGQINMFADNVTILLKINLVDYNKSDLNSNAVNENLTHELKMDTLLKAEIKSLGDTESSRKSTWFSESIGSMFNALISKAASNFTLSLHNIKVAILLPNSPTDSSYMKFNLKSLVLGSIPFNSLHEALNNYESYFQNQDNNKYEKDKKSKTEDSSIVLEPIIWKDLQIRDFSMTVNKIKNYATQKDLIALVKNKSYDTVGVILNPFQMSMQIRGCKDKLANTHFQNLKLLELEMKVNNIEFTPAGEQFVQIVEIMKYMKQESLKFKYHAIHTSLNTMERSKTNASVQFPFNTMPLNSLKNKGMRSASTSINTEKTVFNPKHAWKLAIRAVILMIKQNTDEIGIRPKLRSVLERLSQRRQYLIIYRKIIKTKLIYAYGDKYKSLFIDEEASIEGEELDELGLSKELKKSYDGLNFIFSVSDLILFRLTVLREFQIKGITKEHLKFALTFKKRSFFNWNNWFHQSNSHTLNDKMSNSDIEKPIIENDNIQSNNSTFVFACKCNLSRVAITLYDNFLVDSSQFDFSNLHYSTPIVPDQQTSSQTNTNISKSTGTSNNNATKRKKRIETIPIPPISKVQCLSIILYGTCFTMLSIGKHDKAITCKLGALKFFGYNGMEIISCGEDPNYWLHCNFDKNTEIDERNHKNALFASVRWNKETSDLNSKGKRKDYSRNKSVGRKLSNASKNDIEGNSPSDDFSLDEHCEYYIEEGGDLYEPWSSSSSDDSSYSESSNDSINSENEETKTNLTNKNQHYGNILSAADRRLRNRFRKDNIVQGELQSLIRMDGKNVMFELHLGFFSFNWHTETVIFLTDFSQSISAPLDNNRISEHLSLGLETKPFSAIKSQLAMLSSNQTIDENHIIEAFPNISLQIIAEGLKVSIPVEHKALGKTLHKQKSFLVSDLNKSSGLENNSTPPNAAKKATILNSGIRYFQNPGPSKSPETSQYVQLSIDKISLESGKFLQRSEDIELRNDKSAEIESDNEDSSSIEYEDDSSEDDELNKYNKADLFGAASSYGNLDAPPTNGNIGSRTDYVYPIDGQTANDKLFTLIDQIRSQAVHSVLFRVVDIEICILTTAKTSANSATVGGTHQQNSKYLLTAKPWSMYGLLSPCLIKSSLAHTDMRVDLLCSPLQLLVSTQDIITIIDVVKEFTSLFNPVIADNVAYLVSPRIRRLAGMSELFVDIDIENLNIEFLLESNRSKGDLKCSNIIANALSNYGKIVKLRGKNSFVSISREMIALNQLYNVGIRRDKAVSILRNFISDIVEDCDLELNYYVDKYITLLFMDIKNPSSEIDENLSKECKAVFFYLQISGVHLVHHKLTYDNRSLLCFGDIILFNNERIPLLSITNSLQPRIEHLHQFQTKEPLDSKKYNSSQKQQKVRSKSFGVFSNYNQSMKSSKSASFRNSEQQFNVKKSRKDSPLIPSKSSVFTEADPNFVSYFSINRYEQHFSVILMYELKDLNSKFGEGGLDVSVLYKTLDCNKFDMREGELNVSIRQIDILVATNNILQIVNQAFSTVSQVKSHYRENFRFQPSVQKPKNADLKPDNTNKSPVSYLAGSEVSLDKLGTESTNSYYIHEYKTTLSIVVELSALSLILSVEENYLAKLSLYVLKASMEDVTNLQNKMVYTIVVNSLALIDLSNLGAVHQIAVWKKEDYLPIDVVLEEAIQTKGKLYNLENIHMSKTLKAKKMEEIQKEEKLRLTSVPPVATLVITFDEQRHEEIHQQIFRTLQLNINVDGLRICFLYRFLEELIDFFKDKLISPLAACVTDAAEKAKYYDLASNSDKNNLSHFSDDTSDDETFVEENAKNKQEPEPMNVIFSVDIHINLKDISGVVPRNSNSHELIGVNVDYGSVVISNVSELFSAPNKNDIFEGLDRNESDKNYPLHLDLITNKWRYKPSDETIRTVSTNETAFLIDAIRVKRTLNISKSRKHFSQISADSLDISTGNKIVGIDSAREDCKDNYSYGDFNDTYYSGLPSLSNPHLLPIIEEFDQDEFNDFESSWKAEIENDQEYKRLLQILESNKQSPIQRQKQTPKKHIEQKNVLRVAISVYNVNAFVSFPDVNRKAAVDVIDTDEQKVWLEISHESKVNKFIRKTLNRGTWSENQTWRKVSVVPFNLLVVIDVGITEVKLLFGDTPKLSHIHFNLSQSEFYLLMGFWFDNLNERAQFMKIHDTSKIVDIDSGTTFTTKDSNVVNDNKRKNNVRFSTCSNNSDDSHSIDPISDFLRDTMNDPSIEETKYMKRELPHHSFYSYGNKEFIKYLMERNCTFEILVLFAEVRFECSMDINFFSRKIPNHICLNSLLTKDSHIETNVKNPEKRISRTKMMFKTHSAKYSSEERTEKSSRQSRKPFPELSTNKSTPEGNKTIPFADIIISAVILHIEMDYDVLHMSMSAGECILYDVRLPKKTLIPMALRIASPRDPTIKAHVNHVPTLSRTLNEEQNILPDGNLSIRRTYGYSDFKFGFDMSPSDVHQPIDTPMKMSLILSTITNWNMINFGIDMLDLNVQKLDLILLISDFFSCYFRFKEYGHPGVSEFYNLKHPYVIPYGGNDIRVFINRPHVSILKSPLLANSQVLLLETEHGMFFRYMLDTKSTVKMDLNITDLAVVLVKRYRPPNLNRRIRGSSGSGKGVRTLIEYLNLAMSYHYVVQGNQLDLKFTLRGPHLEDHDSADSDSNATSDTSNSMIKSDEKPSNSEKQNYVDLQSEQLQLTASTVPFPFGVYPLIGSRTDFAPHSCDIVTSYEDLMLCIEVYNDFFDIDESKTSGNNKATTTSKPLNIFCVMSLFGIRLIIVDNVLGLHLPLLQIFLDDFEATVLHEDPLGRTVSSNVVKEKQETLMEKSRRDSFSFELSRITSDLQVDDSQQKLLKQEVSLYIKCTTWADYFNNLRKCWEPLLEKVVATGNFEKSIARGMGITIYISSSLHINISGAFFRCLNDLLTSLKTNSDKDSKDNRKLNSLILKMRGREPLQDEDYMDLDFNDDLAGQSRFDFPENNKLLNLQKRSRRSFPSPVVSHDNNSSNNRSMSRRMNQRRSSIMSILGSQDDDESIKSNHKLDHVPSNPLPPSFKVGFSIENLTGQHIRYLQQWEGNRRTVQYLNNDERGLLNFVASKSVIRNNSSLEETFDVQLEHNTDRESSRNYKKANGNRVAVQVSGHRWLQEIQADVLGVSYEDLEAVIGKLRPTQIFKNNWKIINSLKLMIEVVPYCGGRMLKLRSVFSIKNNTKHKLKILAKESFIVSQNQSINHHTYSDESKDVPFILDAGENFYVPLALMRRSALSSSGKSLGYLYLKPFDLSPIEEELQTRTNYQAGNVEYTTDPINLFQTVTKSYDAEEELHLSSIIGDPLSLLDHNDKRFMQLVCHIQPKIHAKQGKRTLREEYERGTFDYERHKVLGNSAVGNKLPPFCYCIEVQRDSGGSILEKPENVQQSMLSNFFLNKRSEQSLMSPSNFTISIHPPIIIENLLPCGGVFEIVHAVQKRVLWSSFVAAGEAKPVHTVTLEEPLLLQVNLKYCRSSEGVIIHQPKRNDLHESLVGKFADRIKTTIGGLLEEALNDVNEDVASIILTDTVGQRIRLHVENIIGGGGQRQLAIYCPYWIVNTSQYSFRIVEEGTSYFPAGTVTAQKDGTIAVPNSGASFAETRVQNNIGYDQQTSALLLGMNISNLASPGVSTSTQPNESTSFTPQNRINQALLSSSATKKNKYSSEIPLHANRLEGAVFPGCYGQLHSRNNPEFERNSDLSHQLEQLPFKDIVNLSYLYNFAKAPVLLTKQKVKFQFDDTEWTSPFSLDAVGVNQFIKINDYSKGCQELSFTVHLAPGRLSKYTKIVRFLPRFCIVNKLPFNLMILQPTGFAGEASMVEISPDHVMPYHLPALFGERKIALQIEGWYRSVSFSIDQIVTFNIVLKQYIGLGSITHVSTRGAPEYAQVLPPLSSWGIFFETDWNEENIVVKGIQKGSHASKETDIKIGDVLISIDGESVDGKNFELAMTLLKNKLMYGCTVLFRTVEEKFRLIRESALTTTNSESGKLNFTSNSKIDNYSEHHHIHELISPGSPLLSYNSRAFSSKNLIEQQLRKLSKISEQYAESVKHSMEMELRVELKLVESNVMISIQPLNPEKHYEYRIENRSACYKMYYKQKGVVGNNWIIINPGQSRPYIWEDPFKPHKLQVLCGENLLCPVNKTSYATYSPPNQFKVKGQDEEGISSYWEQVAGLNIDHTTVINFDEIGCKVALNLSHKTDQNMIATVKSEGPLKTLLITPSMDNSIVNRELKYCVGFLKDQNIRLQEIIDVFSGLSTSVDSQTTLNLLQQNISEATQKVKEDQRRSIEIDNVMYSDIESFVEGDNKSTEIKSDLLAYCPFDRLLDLGVENLNQLEVEVYEARELPPLVSGKMEDIYCEVSIKTDDLFINALRKLNQKFYTYLCYNTLDPSWLEQKFVFSVPEKAIAEPRRFNLRVTVKARSLVGLDTVLGKADIEFTCLKDEEVVEGWFPLRPARSSLPLKMTGSIRLKLHWIHNSEGYLKYIMHALEMRNNLVKLQLNVQRFALKYMLKLESNRTVTNRIKNKRLKKVKCDNSLPFFTNSVEKNYYELFEALAKKEERANSIILKENKLHHLDQDDSMAQSVLTRKQSAENIRRIVEKKALQIEINEIAHAMDKLQSSDDLLDDDSPVMKHNKNILETNFRKSHSNNSFNHVDNNDEETELPESVKMLCPILMGQKAIMQNWAKDSLLNAHVHYRLSTIMKREKNILLDIKAFRDRFDEECHRNFVQVHIQEGTLEITPIQALHIPETNSNIIVRVSYGDQNQSTFSMPHSSFLTWYQDEDASSDGAKSSIYSEENATSNVNTEKRSNNLNSSLAKRFEVDTKNIKGAIRVRILADRSLSKTYKEIAKIEIPVFNLLNCCSILDKGEYYDRWFPLMLSSEYSSCEGETEKDFRNNIIPEQIIHSVFGNQPCIRLRVRWFEANENNTKAKAHIEESKFYLKFHLPSLSVGLIDSMYSREVMQIAVRGLDLRHSILTEHTEFNLNVTWIQIDNQLPDPVATVILCPTRVKHHQPVVRLQISKNNALSQGKLTSYDQIQLVVQELDLRLEQQTVIASWELLKSFMQEKNYASKSKSNDVSNLMAESNITTIDGMGFSTHYSENTFEWLPSWEEDLLQQFDATTDEIKEDSSNESTDENNNQLNDELDEENIRTMYVDYFTIKPIRLNVSFITTPQILHTGAAKRQRRSSIRSDTIGSGSGSNMSLFFWQMGEVVLDLTSTISDAPIIFNGFEKKYLFKTAKEIANTLQGHYILSALGQLYKIVGSLELVGNPIGLFSSLGTGVKDFFYEPAHALITTPTEITTIGRGMVKGTVSMVSKTTLGTLSFGTNIIRSIGRGFAKLSIDSAYMRQREELQRQQISLAANISRPLKDVYYGFHYAAVGIVKIPVNTMNKGIIKGFIPGVARGLVGLVTNPIVGSFDAVAHSGDFCRDFIETSLRDAILTEPVQRLRLSDLFGPDGRILPYSFPIALGTEILHALDRSNLELGVNMVLTEGGRIIGDAKSMLPRFDSASQEGIRRGSYAESPHISVVKRRSRFSFTADDFEEESIRYLRSGKGMHNYINTTDDDSNRESYGRTEFSSHGHKHNKEYVIYTAIIRQSINMDLVVLITTERIIVTEYHRRLNSPYLKEQWASFLRLNNMPAITPIFERSGGKATLTLSQTGSNTIQVHALLRSSSYTIIANYNEEDVVINIHNCIVAVLHLPENLIPTYNALHNDCVEDEFGIIHIGSWQFSRDFFDSSKVQDDILIETKAIIKELELEEWIHRSSSKKVQSIRNNTPDRNKQLNNKQNNNLLPAWLINEQEESLNAHSHIRNILDHCTSVQEMCRNRPKSRLLLKLQLDELYQGKIEYTKFLETLEILDHANNRNDRKSHVDVQSIDSIGDKRPSASAKRRSSFLFPFRSSVSNAGSTVDLNQKSDIVTSAEANVVNRSSSTSISDRFMAFAKMRRRSTSSAPSMTSNEISPPPMLTSQNIPSSAIKSTTSPPQSDLSPLSLGYGSTVNTSTSIPTLRQTQNVINQDNITTPISTTIPENTKAHTPIEMRKHTVVIDSKNDLKTPLRENNISTAAIKVDEIKIEETGTETSFMPNFTPFAIFDSQELKDEILIRVEPEIDLNNFVPSRTYTKVDNPMPHSDKTNDFNNDISATSVRKLFKPVSMLVDPFINIDLKENNDDVIASNTCINHNKKPDEFHNFDDESTNNHDSSSFSNDIFKPMDPSTPTIINHSSNAMDPTTPTITNHSSNVLTNNDFHNFDDENNTSVINSYTPNNDFFQDNNNLIPPRKVEHRRKTDISDLHTVEQFHADNMDNQSNPDDMINTNQIASLIVTESEKSMKYLLNRLSKLEKRMTQTVASGITNAAGTTVIATKALETAHSSYSFVDKEEPQQPQQPQQQYEMMISNDRDIIVEEMKKQNKNVSFDEASYSFNNDNNNISENLSIESNHIKISKGMKLNNRRLTIYDNLNANNYDNTDFVNKAEEYEAYLKTCQNSVEKNLGQPETASATSSDTWKYRNPKNKKDTSSDDPNQYCFESDGGGDSDSSNDVSYNDEFVNDIYIDHHLVCSEVNDDIINDTDKPAIIDANFEDHQDSLSQAMNVTTSTPVIISLPLTITVTDHQIPEEQLEYSSYAAHMNSDISNHEVIDPLNHEDSSRSSFES